MFRSQQRTVQCLQVDPPYKGALRILRGHLPAADREAFFEVTAGCRFFQDRYLNLCAFQPFSLRLDTDGSFLFLCSHDQEQLSGEQTAAGHLVTVRVGTVPIIHSQQNPWPRNLHMNPVNSVFYLAAFFVLHGHRDKGHVMTACRKAFLLHGKTDCFSLSEGMSLLLAHQPAFCIVSPGKKRPFFVGHFPHRKTFLRGTPAAGFSSQRASVQEELCFRLVGHDGNIDELSFVPVPIAADVQHGSFCPHGLIEIVAVLREPGRICLAEIAASGVVGGRLPDIIDPRPDELAQGPGCLQILKKHPSEILGSPAGTAVQKGGALKVLVGEDPFLHGEMVDSPALQQRSRFASVDHPVGVCLMVLLIVFLSIVIARKLNHFRASLGAFPGHIIAAEGHLGLCPVVAAHLLHKKTCPFFPLLRYIHIRDLITDGPEDHGGVSAVPADPGRHVLPPGLREKTGVVIGGLWQFPHIEQLVHHQKAQSVAEIQEFPCRRVVGRPDRVRPHLLHQKKLPLCRFLVKRRSQCAKIVVKTYAVQLYVFPIQEKAFVCGKFRGTKTYIQPEKIIVRTRKFLPGIPACSRRQIF